MRINDTSFPSRQDAVGGKMRPSREQNRASAGQGMQVSTPSHQVGVTAASRRNCTLRGLPPAACALIHMDALARPNRWLPDLRVGLCGVRLASSLRASRLAAACLRIRRATSGRQVFLMNTVWRDYLIFRCVILDETRKLAVELLCKAGRVSYSLRLVLHDS